MLKIPLLKIRSPSLTKHFQVGLFLKFSDSKSIFSEMSIYQLIPIPSRFKIKLRRILSVQKLICDRPTAREREREERSNTNTCLFQRSIADTHSAVLTTEYFRFYSWSMWSWRRRIFICDEAMTNYGERETFHCGLVSGNRMYKLDCVIFV
jgi:hypothetical protein